MASADRKPPRVRVPGARVIALGNPLRGDDALGPAVVSRLRQRHPEIDAITWEGDELGLLDLWGPESCVVLVDAVLSGAPPGTLHRFDAAISIWPAQVSCHSTHALGLSRALELARTLRRLPRRLVLVGIEADPARRGPAPAAAWRAVDAAMDKVLAEVHEVSST